MARKKYIIRVVKSDDVDNPINWEMTRLHPTLTNDELYEEYMKKRRDLSQADLKLKNLMQDNSKKGEGNFLSPASKPEEFFMDYLEMKTSENPKDKIDSLNKIAKADIIAGSKAKKIIKEILGDNYDITGKSGKDIYNDMLEAEDAYKDKLQAEIDKLEKDIADKESKGISTTTKKKKLEKLKDKYDKDVKEYFYRKKKGNKGGVFY